MDTNNTAWILILENANRNKISENREGAESINQYYRHICNTMFESKTEWLFSYYFSARHNNTFCCLFYIVKLFKVADKYGLFGPFSRFSGSSLFPYNFKGYVESYNRGFKIGFTSYDNKTKSNPEYYQKDVFSEITSFPHGQSIKPYSIYDNREVVISPYMIDYGELIGRYFCAWSIVLDSQILYEPMFKEYLQTIGLTNQEQHTLKVVDLKCGNLNKGNLSGKQSHAEQLFKINDTEHSRIKNLFDHCNSVIFQCTYPIFLQSIEAATFENIDIKTLTKVQDLTHRLSGIMGDAWYADVCKNMKWTKPVCSGRDLNPKWVKQIDKIIPKPDK